MGVSPRYAKYVMRTIGVFVDGDNYCGDALEYALPKIELETDEIQAAGMIGKIDVVTGFAKQEANVKFLGFRPDMLQKIGVNFGAGQVNTFLLTSALIDDEDGKVHSGVCTIKGFIKQMDPGDFKGGDLPEVSYEICPRETRLEIDGKLVYELTPFSFKSGGESQTDDLQRAILNA